MLSKLKTLINQHPNHYIPSTLEFNSIDISSLATQLKLKEKGEERGLKEQPPSSAKEPDSIEHEIINTMEEERKKNYSSTLNQIHAFDTRISALNLNDKISAIKCLTGDAISEFKTQTNEGINELELEKRRVKELHSERKQFRLKNKLNRLAKHPDSLVFYWGIIAVLFVSEWLTNGFFFSAGNENGLLGGIGDAFSVALVNIGISLFAGTFFFKELHHQKFVRKISGGFLLLSYILIAGFFALFVAHYRNALGGETPELASVIACKSMYSSPLNLPDFHTWILAVISFLFSIGAAIDKHKMDDPYPGYSKLERKYEEVTNEYSESHAEIIDKFREIKDDTISEIRNLKEDLSARRIEYENILASRQKVISIYQSRVVELQNQTRFLINLYREANLSTRSSNPPEYFNKQIELKPVEEFPELPQYLLVDLNFNRKINSIFSESEEVTKNLQAKYISIQNNFPLLDELLLDEVTDD